MKNLSHWFRAHKRDLPWRSLATPYRVWVSEVMLQQTQVKTVIPYFERWMERFPTLEKLAEAELSEVIKLWEGLGYYSRARALYEGAKKVVEEFEGELPSDPAKLSTIKGIGPYTVGAILSFAFHKRAAAVDGNVVRVMSRYLGKNGSKASIEQEVLKILPDDKPWEGMEALIELGALICKKKPLCSSCPLKASCKGQAKADEFPAKVKRALTTFLTRTTLLITAENSVLLRPVKVGLWEFPYFEGDFDLGKSLEKVSHSFTRYKATLIPYRFHWAKKKDVLGCVWVPMDDVAQLAFSAGARQLVKHLF